MAVLTTLAADAAAGGLFGLFGTLLGRVASFFERKQDYEHERAEWTHEIKLHDLNMKAKSQETEAEIQLVHQAGSWACLNASIRADSATGKASQWVINILRLVRPALTILLWLITGWIFAVTQDSAIVEAAVFAATAATLWWFGDRAPRRIGTFTPRLGLSPAQS